MLQLRLDKLEMNLKGQRIKYSDETIREKQENSWIGADKMSKVNLKEKIS